MVDGCAVESRTHLSWLTAHSCRPGGSQRKCRAPRRCKKACVSVGVHARRGDTIFLFFYHNSPRPFGQFPETGPEKENKME